MSDDTTLKQRFMKLDRKGDRQHHLKMARRCSELTIPSVIPPEGATGTTQLKTPYQGVGAFCVNSLVSKLFLTMIPPNSPFYKLTVDPMVLEELRSEYGEEGLKSKVSQRLSLIEQIILKNLNKSDIRPIFYRALRACVIGGDVILDVSDFQDTKFYRLDRFVLRRSPSGKVMEIIIKEEIDPEEVPEGMENLKPDDGEQNAEKTLELYTAYVFEDGEWKTWQELEGEEVPDSNGTYPEDLCPVWSLPFNLVDGEHYGRGMVEEYIGDFMSVEGSWKALIQGLSIASLTKFLERPGGMTSLQDVLKAPNGGYAPGREEDIGVLRVEKGNDLQLSTNAIERLEDRLHRVFLSYEAIQRNAERVTAEEIRTMAQELDNTLGGLYSMWSKGFQLPLIRTMMKDMQNKKAMPSLPPSVEPQITTGFEGLGRGHDLNKLKGFIRDSMELGPEQTIPWFNMNDFLTRLAAAWGIDTSGLIKTAEQVAQEQQQQMMAQMAQQAAPNATKGMMDMAQQQQAQQPAE